MDDSSAGAAEPPPAAHSLQVKPEEQTVAVRPPLMAAERVVIKLGTRVLTHRDGRLALSRLYAVVETAASLVLAGREVLLVSSGAVGLGKDALGLGEIGIEDLQLRQACAAVGQSRLMQLYQESFGHLGLRCAQLLLTESDFGDRGRYLNLRNTLRELVRRQAVPVVNENDAVSTAELAPVPGEPRRVFGDNDRLSALVASKLDADLLVLLTDVAGVYDRDPRMHEAASLLSTVDHAEGVWDAAGGPGSAASRGGMRSKVEAASIVVRSGCHAVIASGLQPGALGRVLAGETEGTWFPARGNLPAKRRWIAFAAQTKGSLVLDEGAIAALRERRASLLAAGVQRASGEFRRGEVVELLNLEGARIGRGMMACDAETARRWCCATGSVEEREQRLLVRRERLVLEC